MGLMCIRSCYDRQICRGGVAGAGSRTARPFTGAPGGRGTVKCAPKPIVTGLTREKADFLVPSQLHDLEKGGGTFY